MMKVDSPSSSTTTAQHKSGGWFLQPLFVCLSFLHQEIDEIGKHYQHTMLKTLSEMFLNVFKIKYKTLVISLTNLLYVKVKIEAKIQICDTIFQY